jgi:multidrug efflux pump subunit AcrA (membrane-fusion protein)
VSRARLAGLAVAAVAAVAAVSWAALAGGGGRPDVWEVASGPFVRRVSADGHLRAVKATPISAPVAIQEGVKVAWLAPDGSRVAAGEVVVRLDTTDFEAQRRNADAERQMASEKIAKAEARRGNDLRALERDADLARMEMEAARAFQPQDQEIFSRHERIESEIDLGLAEARRRHADSVRETRAQVASTDLDLLALERRKAEIQIARAEQGLAAIEITAPHAGILLLQRDWRGETLRAGDTVWGGRKLAEIPDLQTMDAEVFVLESDAGGLAVGQEAEVTLDALPGTAWPATVKRVDALARPRLRGVPVQYFGATLELERTDPAVMKPGQRLRATIVLERLESALAVPRQAVFSRQGRRHVFVRLGRSWVATQVELGSAGGGMVVIASGLAPGDQVALRDPHRPLAGGDAAAEGAPAAPREEDGR